MKTKHPKKTKTTSDSARRHRYEAEAGVGGAISGGAVGAMAGPPGAATGAVIGGVVGVLASVAYQNHAGADAARNAQLDQELGIDGGNIGAPNLEHPPAKIGAYSAASCGAGSSSDSEPAEGPIQAPE